MLPFCPDAKEFELSTAPITTSGTNTVSDTAVGDRSRPKSRRRKTSHLKQVPDSRELRDSLRERCEAVAAKLDKSAPLTKDQMEQVARRMLGEAGLDEGYVGWAMVMISSAFWRDAVAATDPSRRLFLLPHCLKHAEGCPADYDQFGMDCKRCGACSIADFRTEAEARGHRVLVAEGSPVVMKIIVSGYVDAIVGVACLNVLEKAIDKILLAGIPCMAVPLLSSDCRNTSVDEDWVAEMIRTEHKPAAAQTRSYVHLMRGAADLFSQETMKRLLPPVRSNEPIEMTDDDDPLQGIDPIAATEAVAYDFLARGGKHSRPFITLAAYDALSGDRCTGPDGAAASEELPDSVRRAAMSIETFHKASLVHDDIEDDDAFRYGQPAVHRRFGLSTAINVGDYMIGLGYRLVSREAAALGSDATADLLDCLAQAHTRLAEGQGAELIWRDARDKRLTPIDALKVYALKTAPAFEAALYSGVRLAGPADHFVAPLRTFCRNLGVAFQILNDLNDWNGDSDNKLSAGGDVLGGRPTVLWALALAGLNDNDQAALLETSKSDSELTETQRIAQVRHLYEKAGAFESALQLVDKHQQRAEEVADQIEPEPLRRLLYYLVDTVLERPSEPQTTVVPLTTTLSR